MIPLIADKRTELEALCRKHKVARLELFGSAVEGGFDPDKSDLDFLVVFEPMHYHDHADAYFGLLFDLEHVFGRRIDLVEYLAIRNPYFKQSVDSTRVLLYAA